MISDKNEICSTCIKTLQIVTVTLIFSFLLFLVCRSNNHSANSDSFASLLSNPEPEYNQEDSEEYFEKTRTNTIIIIQCIILASIPLYINMLFTLISFQSTDKEEGDSLYSSFEYEYISKNAILNQLKNIKDKQLIKKSKKKQKVEPKLDESLESTSTYCETPHPNKEFLLATNIQRKISFPVISSLESNSVNSGMTHRKITSGKQ